MSNENKYFDEMLKENEIKTNYFVSVFSFILSIVFIFYILTFNYDLEAEPNARYMQMFLIVFLILLMISPLMCLIYKGRKPWLKYFILISHILTATCGIIFVESGIYVLLMMVPIAASCLYYKPKFTLIIGITSIVVLFFSGLAIDLYLPILYPDTNFMILQDGLQFTVDSNVNNYVYYYFFQLPIARVPYFIERLKYLIIPEIVIFVILLLICYKITKRAKDMMTRQANDFKDKVVSENDLNLSTIDQDELSLKQITNNNIYEINYYISPDKKAIGNFYDFFKINENRIALVVADVTKKDSSTSLFMSVCKTIISSSLLSGKSLKDTANKVNKSLCSNGSDNMFVSCFIGIVDIKTGQVEYINAGRISPIIMRNNNVYEHLSVCSDVFFGVMNDFDYNTYSFTLNNYEKLLLYADSELDDSRPSEEVFGNDKVIAFLNKNVNLDNKELIDKLVVYEEAYSSEINEDVTLLMYSRKN